MSEELLKSFITLYNFEGISLKSLQFSGGYNEEDTPVPIPNTEVKLLSADDTWMETSWESRSLPDLYQDSELISQSLVLFVFIYSIHKF